MDWLTDWLIAFVSDENNPAGVALLGASAMVEYVFPPFPGDTITLFGAVLITAYSWSFGAVFGAVMLGSVSGAMIDYYFGHRLRLRGLRRKKRHTPEQRRAIIHGLVERFRKHGAVYLVLNRFVPGVRALFFVAAGLAGMKPLPVLLYSAISAAAWNLLLIAVGGLLGANLDELSKWVRHYNIAAGGIIIAIILALLGRSLLLRRRRKSEARSADDT